MRGANTLMMRNLFAVLLMLLLTLLLWSSLVDKLCTRCKTEEIDMLIRVKHTHKYEKKTIRTKNRFSFYLNNFLFASETVRLTSGRMIDKCESICRITQHAKIET